jgi:threonine/homoserine/homoserine lactone efflux protein
VNELVVFAGVIALASISPGPNVILVVNHTLNFGLPRIAPTILGNISLLFVVAVAAALGVSAVLMSMPAAYDALRAIGAAYLAYVGIKALRNAWRSRGGAVVSGQPANAAGPVRRYLQAFFVSATNLGSVFFLAALFPNFLHHDQALLPQFAVLFATLVMVVGAVHFGYALFAAGVQARLGTRRFRSAAQAASGFALLGFSAVIFGSVLRRT